MLTLRFEILLLPLLLPLFLFAIFYPRFPIRVIIREKLIFSNLFTKYRVDPFLFSKFSLIPRNRWKLEKWKNSGGKKKITRIALSYTRENSLTWKILISKLKVWRGDVWDYARGAIFLPAGNLFERVEPTHKISPCPFVFSNFCTCKFFHSSDFAFLKRYFDNWLVRSSNIHNIFLSFRLSLSLLVIFR